MRTNWTSQDSGTSSPRTSPQVSARRRPSPSSAAPDTPVTPAVKAPTEIDHLWSVADVAGFLGVPKKTIYSWRTSGKGPKGFRVGKHLRWHPARSSSGRWGWRTNSDQGLPPLRPAVRRPHPAQARATPTLVQPGLPSPCLRGTPRRRGWWQRDHLRQGTNQPRRARPGRPRLPGRLQTRAESDRRPRRPPRARRRQVEQRRRRTHATTTGRTGSAVAAMTDLPDESGPRMHQVCGTHVSPSQATFTLWFVVRRH